MLSLQEDLTHIQALLCRLAKDANKLSVDLGQGTNTLTESDLRLIRMATVPTIQVAFKAALTDYLALGLVDAFEHVMRHVVAEAKR